MECDWLDGPAFVDWCRGMGFLPPENNQAEASNHHTKMHTDVNLARRLWDWKQEGKTVSVWSADKLLTDEGGHISMIPDHIWLSGKPHRSRKGKVTAMVRKEAVSRVLERDEGVTAVARDLGLHPRTVGKWVQKTRQLAPA